MEYSKPRKQKKNLVKVSYNQERQDSQMGNLNSTEEMWRLITTKTLLVIRSTQQILKLKF